VTGELRRAFIMGFFIYVPFLIIDLVVASTLMSLGMMMLPPAMVSMPFKMISFMLFGGWNLVTSTIMITFGYG
jgi:flagellar biosynthetic protein FliP